MAVREFVRGASQDHLRHICRDTVPSTALDPAKEEGAEGAGGDHKFQEVSTGWKAEKYKDDVPKEGPDRGTPLTLRTHQPRHLTCCGCGDHRPTARSAIGRLHQECVVYNANHFLSSDDIIAVVLRYRFKLAYFTPL